MNRNRLEKTVKSTQSGSGTIQGVDRNSYAIKKHIAEGKELVPEGTEFTVHLKVESEANPEFNEEYDQKVSANGEFVKGSKELPAGTKVTLTEPTFPDVKGVTYGDPKFRAGEEDADNVNVSDDGKSATLTVVEDRNVEVHLDNTAKKSTGAFEITKELVNPDNLPISEDAEFTVDLTWTDEEGEKLEGEEYPAQIKLKAGETKKFYNLPAGTKVKYEESTDSLPKVEGTTWNVKYPDGQEAVVTSEQVAEGKIQNRMVPSTDVTLTKKVTGPAAFKVDDDHVFQVEATWMDGEGNQQQRVVDVKKDGSVNLEGLPLNKEITLVERTEKVSAPEDSENLKWTGIKWTVDGPNEVVQDENEPNKAILTLKGKAGEPVQVDLENKTGGKGLIIIPLPIPLPPFGGSGTPPGSSVVPPPRGIAPRVAPPQVRKPQVAAFAKMNLSRDRLIPRKVMRIAEVDSSR